MESLQGHLQDPTKILIGYSRGLLVIWSQATHCVDHIFLGNQVSERSLHAPHSGPLYTPLAHAILSSSVAAGEPVLGAWWQHRYQLTQ